MLTLNFQIKDMNGITVTWQDFRLAIILWCVQFNEMLKHRHKELTNNKEVCVCVWQGL